MAARNIRVRAGEAVAVRVLAVVVSVRATCDAGVAWFGGRATAGASVGRRGADEVA